MREMWANVVDAEILAIRGRLAQRLRAEHARMALERQRAADARIVDEREARVLEKRGHAIVRSLVKERHWWEP